MISLSFARPVASSLVTDGAFAEVKVSTKTGVRVKIMHYDYFQTFCPRTNTLIPKDKSKIQAS